MRIPFASLILPLALACVVTPASAQIYKWVDANGVTHYGEKPPDAGDPARQLDIRLKGNDPAPTATTECYTIQCQYERMRNDRLVRDAEWRREMETRARLAESRKRSEATETAWEDAPPPYVVGGTFVRRPVVTPRRPLVRAPSGVDNRRRDPPVSLRSRGER